MKPKREKRVRIFRRQYPAAKTLAAVDARVLFPSTISRVFCRENLQDENVSNPGEGSVSFTTRPRADLLLAFVDSEIEGMSRARCTTVKFAAFAPVSTGFEMKS